MVAPDIHRSVCTVYKTICLKNIRENPRCRENYWVTKNRSVYWFYSLSSERIRFASAVVFFIFQTNLLLLFVHNNNKKMYHAAHTRYIIAWRCINMPSPAALRNSYFVYNIYIYIHG